MLTIGNFPTLIGGSTGLALGIGAVLVLVTLAGVVVGAHPARGHTPPVVTARDRPVTTRSQPNREDCPVTATAPASVAAGAATHPLDLATAEEFRAVREVLADAGLLGDSVRFFFAGLEEPDKADVLAHTDGDPSTGGSASLLLDLSGAAGRGTSSSRRPAARSTRPSSSTPPPAASSPIIDAEFEMIEEIVLTPTPSGATRCGAAASTRRRCAPCRCRPACTTTRRRPGGASCAGARVPPGPREGPPWAHPVDGLVAYVDLTAREVSRVVDHAPLPVPDEPGNFDDPECRSARSAPR